MKIFFMGTPDFAVPCLEKLIENGDDIVGVFSQPDKPVGRKQILTPPAVKTVALKHNIPVYQPTTLKDAKTAELIKSLEPDLIIVVAYGKILPNEILDIAPHGCINVHASLLPKYRGSAPIQWAVLNGDSETGVTVMQMNSGVDTGDILLVKKAGIGINETSEELFDKLSVLGSQALVECINNIDSITPRKQNDEQAVYVEKITKELSPIDWSKTAFEVHNKIRGLQSWPCAVTKLNGKNLKIHKSVLSDKTGNKCAQVVDNKDVLTVCCGDGKCIDIHSLQLDGKKKMDTKSFLLGNKIEINTMLGE